MGGLLGTWVAETGNAWEAAGRVLMEPATEAEGKWGGALLPDRLAGGRGVWAGPPTETCWPGSVGLVLWGWVGLAGATVTAGPLPAGRDPKAGVAVVKFSRPGRPRSLWKVKGLPESRGSRGCSRGQPTPAWAHCSLSRAQ